MKNSGNIFIGIIAAATAGVVIGMLIAPEKGEDLRKNIRHSAGDWAKKMSDLMAQGKEQLDGIKSLFGHEVNDLRNEGANFKNQVTEAYKNTKA
jgi:gas vesicle protein